MSAVDIIGWALVAVVFLFIAWGIFACCRLRWQTEGLKNACRVMARYSRDFSPAAVAAVEAANAEAERRERYPWWRP